MASQFLILLFIISATAVIQQAQYLYWLEYENPDNIPHGNTLLWKTNLANPTETTNIVRDFFRVPGDVVVDIGNNYTYFTERRTIAESGRIQRYNLTGGNVDVVLEGNTDPEGISLDMVDTPGWMYFANGCTANCSLVQRIDTQLHAQRTVADYGTTWQVVDVAVDPSQPSPSIYTLLVAVNSSKGMLQRCSIDGCIDPNGKNTTQVLWTGNGTQLPFSIALDNIPRAILPESDTSSSSLLSSGLSSQSGSNSSTKPATYVYFVTNDGTNIGTSSTIYRILTNGSSLERLVATHLEPIVTGIAIDPVANYAYWGTSRPDLSRGGCSIWRAPLNNFAPAQTIIILNSTSRIYSLALDVGDVQQAQPDSSSGWGWYIYFAIVVGSLIVGAVILRGLFDLVKLCRDWREGKMTQEERKERDVMSPQSTEENPNQLNSPYHAINNPPQ